MDLVNNHASKLYDNPSAVLSEDAISFLSSFLEFFFLFFLNDRMCVVQLLSLLETPLIPI